MSLSKMLILHGADRYIKVSVSISFIFSPSLTEPLEAAGPAERAEEEAGKARVVRASVLVT